MVVSILNKKQEPIPLVVVEGFLGSKDPSYWHNFLSTQKIVRPIIFVNLGPLASIHDRCCELYYQLKGGTVDYGEKHSKEKGHARYGRTYPGIYKKWSKEFPLHFLGHSLGGLTLIRFQNMLKEGYFNLLDSADMMVSITSFSSPLRGSTLTYILGRTEKQTDKIRICSLGAFIYRFAYLLCWLKLKFIDLIFDHWNLDQLSIFSLIYNLIFNVQFDNGSDNGATDLMMDQCLNYNENYLPNENTYYLSYATKITYQIGQFSYPYFKLDRKWLMLFFSSLMGHYTFKFKYENENEIDWRPNDGILPTISQFHPKNCNQTNCKHLRYNNSINADKPLFPSPEKGKWYVLELENICHFNLLRNPNSISKEYLDILTSYWIHLNEIEISRQPKPKLMKNRHVSFEPLKVRTINRGYFTPLLSPSLFSPTKSPVLAF